MNLPSTVPIRGLRPAGRDFDRRSEAPAFEPALAGGADALDAK
jgi:hypothetical protein